MAKEKAPHDRIDMPSERARLRPIPGRSPGPGSQLRRRIPPYDGYRPLIRLAGDRPQGEHLGHGCTEHRVLSPHLEPEPERVERR